MTSIRALRGIALCIGAVCTAAVGAQADPVSVLAAFAQALQARDTEAALALWSERCSMIDELGTPIRGKEQLRVFIKANANWLRRVDLESIEASGYQVRWKQPHRGEEYKKLKVSPVMTGVAMRVRNGLIESMVLHFPEEELGRIEKACAGSPAIPVMLRGQPCAKYLETARAHSTNVPTLMAAP